MAAFFATLLKIASGVGQVIGLIPEIVALVGDVISIIHGSSSKPAAAQSVSAIRAVAISNRIDLLNRKDRNPHL